MIEKLKYVISEKIDPFYNLALENYLLDHVEEDECILYLWQNEKTVVIGRNQSAFKECKIGALENDGGVFIRRLSGGGAVFHDLGNLNFTFLLKKKDYNVEKQLEVILKALEGEKIQGEKSGRNDITVDNKKISGNAFYEQNGNCYHHGTLLIKVDKEKLSHYLNVSRDKLVAKGVESVKARIANLHEFNGNITIESMKKSMISAFSKAYGKEVALYPRILQESLEKYKEKFQSIKFLYGKNLDCNYSLTHRFPWGGIELVIQLEEDRIKECVLYTDSIDISIGFYVENILMKCRFSSNDIRNKYYESLIGEDEITYEKIELMEYIIQEVEDDGI